MSAAPPPNPPGTPRVESLSCPNCGAPLTLRSMGRAASVVCDHCGSILDARSPQLTILQRFDSAQKEKPLIPLGSRGKWRGAEYEVIGYQHRQTVIEDITYGWREYLLFNPYKGFRYFTEYNGHWNDATVATALPETAGTRAKYLGKTYKYFQECIAKTVFVLGEFPWQISVGDTCDVTDYIAPPYVLSSETAENETTWTLGEYIRGAEIWKAFELPGSPPIADGVFENQPDRMGTSARRIWLQFAILAAVLFAILAGNEIAARRDQVFRRTYAYQESGKESSFVTPEFELAGRTSSVRVRTETDVSNQWIYLNYALINEDTGQAYDFGREVSYYSGTDSDGNWSEGSPNDSAILPSIPSGRYYLRIEPESDANCGNIPYTVTVTRDVPALGLYLAAFAALVLPALFISWRAYNFEHLRWAESTPPLPGSCK